MERTTYYFNLDKIIPLHRAKCNSKTIGIKKKYIYIYINRFVGNLGTKYFISIFCFARGKSEGFRGNLIIGS